MIYHHRCFILEQRFDSPNLLESPESGRRPVAAPDSLDIDGVPAAIVPVIGCATGSADAWMFNGNVE